MSTDDKEEIKRHFDAVAEGLRSDFRLVAGGVAMNTERLDRVDARLDHMGSRLGRVGVEMRHGFRKLHERLGALESKQAS